MRRVLWVVASIVAGCGGGGGGGGGGGENAQAALTVVSVEPSDRSTAVEPDSPIRVEFNFALDPAAIDDTTFVVEGPAGPVEGNRTTDGRTATFTPARRLSLATEYEVRLDPKIRSTDGVRLGAPHVSRFTIRDGTWRPTETLPYNIENLRVATDSSGNAMTAWTRGSDIFYREFRVNSGWENAGAIRVGANGSNLSLASAPDGSCLAAWVEYSGGSGQVCASHFVPRDGWSPPTQILSGDNATEIAMDAEGRGIVLTGFQGYLLARVYQPGAGWEDPQIVTSQPVSLSGNLRVRMDVAGGAYVVWSQSASGQNQIGHARYEVGVGWSDPEVIHSTASGTSPPQLAVGPSGSAIVVWSQGSYWEQRVYFNRYDPQQGWAGAQQTHPLDGANAMIPFIAGDPDGRLMMVVSRDEHVWSSAYAPTTGWEAPTPVHLQGKSSVPRIALDAGGNAVAVWSQAASVYSSSDLWSSRWTHSGGWSSPVGLETALGSVHYDAADGIGIAISGTGATTVVWNEGNPGNGSDKALFKRFE